MQKTLAFNELWKTADTAAKGCNGLCHHPCCDVWTTRAAKTKRASHPRTTQWRQLILTLDKTIEDKKQALLAKMTEEGWRLPALLNEVCQAQSPPTLQQKSAFRPHIPVQQPQDTQASPAPHHFPQQVSEHSLEQDQGSS